MPPRGVDAPVVAFDTGPGVAIIDGVVRTLAPALAYDVDGALAQRGTPIESVGERRAGASRTSRRPPPKSTGRELFDRAYIARFIERCRAAQPARDDRRHRRDGGRVHRALHRRCVPALHARADRRRGDLRRRRAQSGARARTHRRARAAAGARSFDSVFFDGDAKEAVAFAFLGHLFLERRAGNSRAATGARGPRVLGKLTPA